MENRFSDLNKRYWNQQIKESEPVIQNKNINNAQGGNVVVNNLQGGSSAPMVQAIVAGGGLASVPICRSWEVSTSLGRTKNGSFKHTETISGKDLSDIHGKNGTWGNTIMINFKYIPTAKCDAIARKSVLYNYSKQRLIDNAVKISNMELGKRQLQEAYNTAQLCKALFKLYGGKYVWNNYKQCVYLQHKAEADKKPKKEVKIK